MVNDFEYRVYHSSDTLSTADFDTYYQEAGDALGGYDTIMDAIYGENKATATAYWKRVVLENPCYYISYAMSKIPSLEIYSYARNDLALARQKYKKTYTLENDLKLTEFLRVLDNAELYSPFDSKAFDLIESLNIIETNS
jgi:oligoendopeptidase F